MRMDEAYSYGRRELEEAGVGEAQVDAWYLLEYATKLSRADYFKEPRRELTKEQELRYFLYIEKRAQRIPLQHITGEQEFMGLPFLVNEFVLVPRQDTEILAEIALALLKSISKERQKDVAEREPVASPMRILDMGTGSGCILLSLLHYMKEDSCLVLEGVGADISNEALQVARENAKRMELEAEWVHGDLFSKVEGKFQVIVSNPPYVRTAELDRLQAEVRYHDPRIALDGNADGLYFYRRIVEECKIYLEPGGHLLFEIGHDQAEDVAGMMRNAGFSKIKIKKDLAGLDRVVSGVYDRCA